MWVSIYRAVKRQSFLSCASASLALCSTVCFICIKLYYAVMTLCAKRWPVSAKFAGLVTLDIIDGLSVHASPRYVTLSFGKMVGS